MSLGTGSDTDSEHEHALCVFNAAGPSTDVCIYIAHTSVSPLSEPNSCLYAEREPCCYAAHVVRIVTGEGLCFGMKGFKTSHIV